MAVARNPEAGRETATGAAPGVGRHLLADFWTDDVEALRWVADWERMLPDACRRARATVLGARFHQFRPHGVTGIVLLAESHASVHTWPERGLATLDVFTCGSMDAAAVLDAVRAALRPTRERVTALERGQPAPPSRTAPGPCV
jgi:S-adenosylmethionine decarboxylase